MVPFASYVGRGQSKPRLIFSRINGPNVSEDLNILWSSKTSGILVTKSNLLINRYKRCSLTGGGDGG